MPIDGETYQEPGHHVEETPVQPTIGPVVRVVLAIVCVLIGLGICTLAYYLNKEDPDFIDPVFYIAAVGLFILAYGLVDSD